jgi:hypothetical protein
MLMQTKELQKDSTTIISNCKSTRFFVCCVSPCSVTLKFPFYLHYCLVNLCLFFSFPGFTIAHCDAGAAAELNGSPDLIDELNNKIRDSIQYARKDDFQFPPKEYPSELKPLFSAFGLKNFSVVTLRSFLLYYLSLIQPQPHTHDEDEDDDDLFQDDPEEKHLDLVTPFYNSVKQIIREASSLIFLFLCRLFQ